MGMIFATHSGVETDPVENELSVGGSTCFRLQMALGLIPSESGELPLEEFAAKLDEAMTGWGSDTPGYPDAKHCQDYGRGPEYYFTWLSYLHEEVVLPGREMKHSAVVWF